MFTNYLKVAIRNLLKNKLHSGINIAGLAVAFAASIIIFLFARNELTYDAFHKKADSIYLVYKERITPTGTQITRDTWMPMAPALVQDYPVIEKAARNWASQSWVEVDGQRFQESVDYADPTFFEMFTFLFAKGKPESAFEDLHSAVITKEIARKYFGNADPIGKRITIDYQTDYVIRGVLEDIPQNSTIELNIVVPVESAPFYEQVKDEWGGSFLFTYVQLAPGITPAQLEQQFPEFVTKIWEAELNKSMNLKLLPLPELYNDLTGAHVYAYILLGVAGIILLIASINFMNLTTARSLERAREIGMRKVLGALRLQLIKQFLMESLVMAILALVVGLGLVELFLPMFNSLYDVALSVSYTGDFLNILALLGLAVTVGLLAGSYPSVVLARHQPADALRGSSKSTVSGLRLRYAMVITQFCLAIILIIGTGVMWQQLQYMRQANLNFEKENVLAITIRANDFQDEEVAQVRIESFKNELRRHSGIVSVASSTHIPGRWPGWFTFAYPTDRDETQRLRVRRAFVDANYFETYGMEFVEGRNFSEQMATDAEQAMIINEAALRDIGWPTGTGRQVRVGETVYTIIGVVKDYHFQSLASEVAPILHFYRPPDSGVHRVISVRLASGDIRPALSFIRDKWQAVDPSRKFEYFFVDENFDRLYASENRLTTVTGAFTVLAILIACLGLFGLASLMVAQRTKEIGIRKTLGATVTNIVLQLTKTFTLLVGLAFIIACPLAYYLANTWLNDFAYRITIGLEIFVSAGILAVVVGFVTVSYHSIKAALMNPVDSLRYE